MSQIKLSNYYIKNIVKLALNEDLYPSGDITSNLVKNSKIIKVKLISNQQAVVAGLEFAKQTFKLIDSKIKFIIKKKEGSLTKKNELIGTIEGKAESILIDEMPIIPIYTYVRQYQLSNDVKGWYPNYLDHHHPKYIYLERD